MADYAPPSGPPPPKVPQGWKAVWNDQYKEWFFVNIYTKKSQWDKPTEPVYPPGGDEDESAAPPSYDDTKARATGPEKGGLGTNNPFRTSQHDISEDEKLARQLQEEENRRAGVGSSTDRGEADSYYSNNPTSGAYSQSGGSSVNQAGASAADQDGSGGKSRGLFGKLFNKKPSHLQPQGQYYPQQPGYGPPGAGYPPPQGYYPPVGGYGGYGPPAQYGRPGGGGLGAGGAAALGLAGGVVGGMLLEDTFEHSGGDDGGDNGGYAGDDGGGDFGGADF